MTSAGSPSPRSWTVRVGTIVVVPILVGLVAFATAPGSGTVPSAPRLVESLDGLAARCARVAADALDRPFSEAAAGISPTLRERMDGIAVWQDDPRDWLEWTGTPEAPPESLLAANAPSWTLVRTGATTRLVAVAGPDEVGRRATATFRLDAPYPGLGLTELLPDVAAGARLEIRPPLDPEPGGIPWPQPDGDAVRIAAHPATAVGSVAGGLAAVTFAALLAWALPWGAWTRTPAGAAAAVAAVALARAVLLAPGTAVPGVPATLAEASDFGTDALFGLFGSPLDLAWTGLAVLLAVRAAVSGISEDSAARPAARTVSLAALSAGAVAILAWVAHVVAVEGRVRPFALGGAPTGLSGAVVSVGLAAFLLAAAEPLAALARRSTARSDRDRRVRRAVVGIAAVPLAALTGFVLQDGYDRLALDRLETEFAPQVLDQGARRRLALDSAVEWSATEAARMLADRIEPSPEVARNLVYDLWSRGALFHAGYRSSLSLHDRDGRPLAHFGFDLPPLEETLAFDAAEREESFELLATVRRPLLHAERPVRVGGSTVAYLVAHVADEPDNLGFLPVPRAYLACLGKGDPAVVAGDGAAGAAPEYVEYSPVGVARFHTLAQPPGWTYAFDKAAIEGRSLRITAGGVPYFALPLIEPSRLHLLLVPAPGLLDRLGTFARLALLAIAVLLVADGGRALFRRGGPARLATALRRSYVRKLVAALLVAAVVPWVGLSLALRSNLERRGEAARETAATQLAVVARRVIEDFIDSLPDEAPELPDDPLLYWLRRLVGQDIHLYERGVLVASSKRELFDAGLAVPHLPASVNFEINQSNRPALVRSERLGAVTIPVAYAPVRAGPAGQEVVVAVPLVLHQPETARALDRNVELMLLSTLLVAGVLAAIAAPMARAVARPVRDLVRAAGRVASGDETVRLSPHGEDEVADLTRSFNTMVESLARRRADLERRRDYIEALLQHATTGVVSVDSRGRVVTLNPAAAGLLSSEGARVALDVDLAEATAAGPALAPLTERLRRPPAGPDPEEVNLVREDGTTRRLRMVRAELPDPEGGPSGRLILLEDVTDLMRRNQLEAWAEMARAIAHEIKNPLTPIQLSAEHLERVLHDRGTLPSPEIDACLATVRKQVRALREIASEFSAYARVPALAPESTDPETFLRETVAPYRAGRPEGIDIVERYAPCPPARIDRRVLGRAVVNLIENALQAMPDGGTLTVACAPDGDGARLTVADTGHGLSDEARARLFEPYFSTKSSGTGLGLAIVLRTVEGHGGRIDVESREGGGTGFHIRLPPARATGASRG